MASKHIAPCLYCACPIEDMVSPRRLPCGHVFCVRCLSRQLRAEGHVTCLACKTVLEGDTHPDSLPADYGVALSCDGCLTRGTSNKATRYCRDCKKKLCGEHTESHNEILPEHGQVVLLSERLDDSRRSPDSIRLKLRRTIVGLTDCSAVSEMAGRVLIGWKEGVDVLTETGSDLHPFIRCSQWNCGLNVHDNRLYLAAEPTPGGGDALCSLLAYAESGEEVAARPCRIPNQTFAVHGNQVYVPDGDNFRVTVYSMASGEVVRHIGLNREPSTDVVMGICVTPDGRMLLSCLEGVFCVDIESGTQIWYNSLEGDQFDIPEKVVANSTGPVYVSTGASYKVKVWILSPDTGKLVKKLALLDPTDSVDDVPSDDDCWRWDDCEISDLHLSSDGSRLYIADWRKNSLHEFDIISE